MDTKPIDTAHLQLPQELLCLCVQQILRLLALNWVGLRARGQSPVGGMQLCRLPLSIRLIPDPLHGLDLLPEDQAHLMRVRMRHL